MESIKSLQIETLPESFPNRMSAEEIIEDLRNTLNPGNFSVKGSELMQTLVGYAELAVEPVGWQALWRPDSRTKPDLKNRLHSMTVVEVVNLDYDNLEAAVEFNDNSRNTEIVSLIELHPLKEQENSAINIETTNFAIQKIRFFIHHLCFPWDADIQENWFEIHFPVRVKMFCELRSGMLSQEIVARYHYLLTEAFEVERKLQQFAEKVPESEDEMDEESVESISNLNAKLEQIQQDVEILLNPSTRMLLFGSKVTRVKSTEHADILLVIQGQTIQSTYQILNEMETFFGAEVNIRCYPSLQTALDDSRADDIIALPKGIHSLLTISSLRLGGSLIGIGNREDVVIHLGCNSEVGLAFDEGSVTIKNCTVLVNNKQSGISVKGNLFLEQCILRGVSRVDEAMGEEECAVASWKGIYMTPHSNLLMKNSVVSNFDVGLRVRDSAKVTASNTEISACNIGFLVEEYSDMNIKQCIVKDCKEFAVVVEMESESDEEMAQLGGVELLETIPKTFKSGEFQFTSNATNVKLEY